MTTELTKQQIASLLEKLHEQYDLIKTKEEKIPQIELDLLLNNTRNLYEALLQLNKINSLGIVLLKQEVVIEDQKPEDLKIEELKITEPEKKEIIAELNQDMMKL